MNEPEREQLGRLAACWKRARERMEQLRREELPRIDTQQSLLSLASAFESYPLHYQPLPTLGLVEQQYWFRKLFQNRE
jgi:16S rRNA U1498 N3-methylase RsmE